MLPSTRRFRVPTRHARTPRLRMHRAPTPAPHPTPAPCPMPAPPPRSARTSRRRCSSTRDVTATAEGRRAATTMIAALKAEGGWGNGNVMQIDFSIDVLTADELDADAHVHDDRRLLLARLRSRRRCRCRPAATSRARPATRAPATATATCIVYQTRRASKLYEMWRANITSTTFYGGCLAVWNGAQDVHRHAARRSVHERRCRRLPDRAAAVHGRRGRGGPHRSRDPLHPAERPRHAGLRRARRRTARSTTGGANAPVRTASTCGCARTIRSTSLPTEGARVVARAMQKYGMYHADGGNIALTAQSDRHTTAQVGRPARLARSRRRSRSRTSR